MDRTKRIVKEAYEQQRTCAKRRNIEWNFTFDTWCDVWEQSNKFNHRGRGADLYCMGRKGDQGGYSPDNVEIITNRQNVKDSHTNKKHSSIPLSHMRKQRRTKFIYVYNGVEYERRYELSKDSKIPQRKIGKMLNDKDIIKYERIDACTLYKTPFGIFETKHEAIDVIRTSLNQELTRQAIWAKFKSRKDNGYDLVVIPSKVIETNHKYKC